MMLSAGNNVAEAKGGICDERSIDAMDKTV